jgi:23S rRNA (adenine2503-C2)-methyltransferase
MGMGEPFLNYDRVLAAAKLLSFPIEAAISAEAITISTVGLVPQIEKFTSEDRLFAFRSAWELQRMRSGSY